MYKLVEDAQGMKKLKPMDLTKAMMQMYGDEVDKKACARKPSSIAHRLWEDASTRTSEGVSSRFHRKEGAAND